MAQFSRGFCLALGVEGKGGVGVREEGGFAAVGVAEEEDRDCGCVVHGRSPIFLMVLLFWVCVIFWGNGLRNFAFQANEIVLRV